MRLGSTADAPPEIDTDYIPPLLACEAWSYLQNQILGNIANAYGSKANILADQMNDRGVAFESGHREDLERIFQLHAFNVALGYLVNLPLVRGIHPLTAYLELCRAVGQIAIFLPERRMPQVPVYNHDDLGSCFHAIRKLLLLLVGRPPSQEYVKRPFVGARFVMKVALEPEWFTDQWTFYMGVESPLSMNEISNLLTLRLNTKLGSSELVEGIYSSGKGGVKARPEAAPPRVFPGSGWTYWKLDRTSEAWQAVERSQSLGIRFNERQVVGGIDGEDKVQIRTDQGQLVPLAFALFAIPQSR